MPEENVFQEGEDTIKPWDQEPVQQPQPVQEQIVQEVQEPVQQEEQEEMAQLEWDQVQVNSQEVPVSQKEANYHPSFLTKVLSGIFRFSGIISIRSGVLNLLDAFLFGGGLIIFGIGLIILGKLIYFTKSWVHTRFLIVFEIIVFIIFLIIATNTRELEDFSYIIWWATLLICLYFSICAIIWKIKCRKLKKKGIVSGKILDSTPEKKTVGIITILILFLFVVINCFYGKFRYSKIPVVDATLFEHKEHNIPLPDEENAIAQLKLLGPSRYTEAWKNIELFSPYFRYYYDESKLGREWHQDECEVITSGNQSYCGTWAWNNKTIDRYMNNYFYKLSGSWGEEKEKQYIMIDDKKVTEKEYIAANEKEIKERIDQLEKILALDYYLPNDKFFYYDDKENASILIDYGQAFARSSVPLLQYYTQKKDWDMVVRIIKLNSKIAGIFEDIGSLISILISNAIHGVIDETVNSSIGLYPQQVRNELIEIYSKNAWNKENILMKVAIGENVVRNEAKESVLNDARSYKKYKLFKMLYYSPFNSKKDTERLMGFLHNCLVHKEQCTVEGMSLDDLVLEKLKYSIYNKYGEYSFLMLAPRLQDFDSSIDRTIYRQQALLDNLKAGKYVSRFNKEDWTNKEAYEQNLLVPPEE